ncbi:tgtA5 cluster protein 1 [Euzebya pacifica]|uniref:TgtA5 cluster protein 1 n=1 Tax=Euzebya pacifica TaxID=1608957 RepID=A0A346XS51_9ACTN|nr:DGQHR domain-containing protein DpdB [Euzebya pacifica]AXV05048.1 tgtA5 cluster protein 1 [Euzebya pacifica]
MTTTTTIRVPAIEIKQGENRTLYSFAVDAKSIHDFASVTRAKRDEANAVEGYQRPEAVKHIRAIKDYLEAEDPMIPNALVVAFDSRVKFTPLAAADEVGYASHGHLEIPIVNGSGEDKPGFIVDGQQRSAAVREANVGAFPMAVTAFITDSLEEQRAQFILVNSTKPLPKGLIHELLPTTQAKLPRLLERKRFPAYLLERLNYDTDSPMHLRIRTSTNPDGIIKDNSVLRMVDNSLTEGGLYRFRDPFTGAGDEEPMLAILKNYWTAVAKVFPEAWEETPRRSRLVHGAGVIAMGFLMDAILDREYDVRVPTIETFETEIRSIEEVCRWTRGFWEFGPGVERRWNELQNTSKDQQLLSNYLLAQYRMTST